MLFVTHMAACSVIVMAFSMLYVSCGHGFCAPRLDTPAGDGKTLSAVRP